MPSGEKNSSRSNSKMSEYKARKAAIIAECEAKIAAAQKEIEEKYGAEYSDDDIGMELTGDPMYDPY